MGSLLGGGIVLVQILCYWLKMWRAARTGRMQDPGEWSSSAGKQTTTLLKRTIKPEGLGDLERATLDMFPLATCQEKEKNNKSYTKQKSSHPTGWCTGRLHLDGCNTAPWLGAGDGGGKSLCVKEVKDGTLAKDFGYPSQLQNKGRVFCLPDPTVYKVARNKAGISYLALCLSSFH